MEAFWPFVVVPAAVFAVFAVALGARNPLRWAAWGAILGPVAFAVLLYADQHMPLLVAYHAPTYTPTTEQPAKPNPFDDLVPPPKPYKVPESEQIRGSGSLY
jgi:hypothetical protein